MASIMSSKIVLKSNELIETASKSMEEYQFPENGANGVGIIVSDTGVIILIILYFIEHEPNICRSKLEYYLLLLDRKCFEANGTLLFHWSLKNGRIKKFKSFIKFMEWKELICLKGEYSFKLTDKGKALRVHYAKLINIAHWVEEILCELEHKTAWQIKSVTLQAKPSQKYLDALDNISNLINATNTEQFKLHSLLNHLHNNCYITVSEAAQKMETTIEAVLSMCLCFAKKKKNEWIIPTFCIDMCFFERENASPVHIDFAPNITPMQFFNAIHSTFTGIAINRTRRKLMKLRYEDIEEATDK